MRKFLLVAALAVGAVATVGGCGTPSGSPTAAAPAATITTSPNDTSTPDPEGAGTAGPAGTPKPAGTGAKPVSGTTGATIARCHTGDLSARLTAGEPYEHNDEHFTDVRVVFENTGGKSCTMYGFPGADLIGGSGRRYSLPRAGDGGRITLKAGAAAHTVIRIWDVPNAESPTLPSQVELTPPDETTHLTLAWPKSLPVAFTTSTEPGIGLPNAIEPVAAGA
ncbi:DUF4232 domain-containing protein [Actinoplanes sp. NPDC020271]|uniref:DUF4232 domain-containing protein n=1 Tax=Actinoplanes sp. NPDC020271 TaxID=3363896 RepID=UPI0037A7BBC8